MLFKHLKCFGGVKIYLTNNPCKKIIPEVHKDARRFILAACFPPAASRRLSKSSSKANPVVTIKAFFWKKNCEQNINSG